MLFSISWFSVHVTLPGDCSQKVERLVTPLEGIWHFSYCFLDFLFILLTDLSPWVVSKKSGHLGFCVRLNGAATVGFFMQIRNGPLGSLGW